ncbi:GntR family transcriptional regulator [Streptomyces silvensis]|uniref:GntR family transcriptional regulator n=1 Tax=Streptomyces silvensis TaxID=1765722 RepID=A0A0W7XBA0_9ACTN|nr:GntR family transcriptional regulator [Streptomyces silvensis]KUF19858.1 GntR family transcriptional regulator [Streptomyces silvensis]
MVEYRIDRRSGVATYLQIVQQTRQALRLGLLEPGDKLPTAREVVEATAVNPNTVLKAYRELEREGLVEARRGLGTFVRRSLGGAPADTPLHGELLEWATRARAAGLDREDTAALFAAVLEEKFPQPHAAAPEQAVPQPHAAPEQAAPQPQPPPERTLPQPQSVPHGTTTEGDPA